MPSGEAMYLGGVSTTVGRDARVPTSCWIYVRCIQRGMLAGKEGAESTKVPCNWRHSHGAVASSTTPGCLRGFDRWSVVGGHTSCRNPCALPSNATPNYPSTFPPSQPLSSACMHWLLLPAGSCRATAAHGRTDMLYTTIRGQISQQSCDPNCRHTPASDSLAAHDQLLR
jgi:hypothetical protein